MRQNDVTARRGFNASFYACRNPRNCKRLNRRKLGRNWLSDYFGKHLSSVFTSKSRSYPSRWRTPRLHAMAQKLFNGLWGFQVFSLARLRKLSEAGVKFQSHIDGSTVELTPEKVVELQVGFNSDIQMKLDICSQYGISKQQTQEELALTINWLKRGHALWKEYRDGKACRLPSCDNTPDYKGQYFPIVQGGFFRDLRLKSLEEILKLDTEGLAIGGLSVGEPPEVYSEFLAFTASQIPLEKAKYIMGVGTPEYVLDAVKNGIDIFDCVLPTRNARNGSLFTTRGPISIKKSEYEFDFSPIDSECSCRVCQKYSRAYLRHLFREHEILYIQLASYHNLYFLNNLILQTRKSIYENRFNEFMESFLKRYNGRD